MCYHRSTLVFLLCAASLVLVGCGVPGGPNIPVRDISWMTIYPPGVIIQSDGGSPKFVLRSGEVIKPPFYCTWQNEWATTTWEAHSTGPEEVSYGALSNNDLIDNWQVALSGGARLVRVVIPGKSKPLYGVLALYPIPLHHTVTPGPNPDDEGLWPLGVYSVGSDDAARIYTIALYQPTISAVSGKHVVLTYGATSAGFQNGNYYTWMLWLSDKPFVNSGH